MLARMNAVEYEMGERAYLQCMQEQYEHDPETVDWDAVSEMLEEMHKDACYVDECQSEQSDWRWA